MKRAQFQFPDELYFNLKQIAEKKEWSINELIKRSAEYTVGIYSPMIRAANTNGTNAKQKFKIKPRSLGKVLAKASNLRELANEE